MKGMDPSAKQSYENHRRLYPLHHFIFGPLSLVTLLAAIVYIVVNIGDGGMTYADWLIVSLSLMTFLLGLLARRSGLVVQDRSIRVEEQLRHYMLTGSPLDPRLTKAQVIALRFASDQEFPQLAARAAAEGLQPKEIKKAIQEWRPDLHRV